MPSPAPLPSDRFPVKPAYGAGCISSVVPALLAPPSSAKPKAAWLPEPVANARQLVLLVLDGLGWEQLRDRSHLAPILSSAAGFDRPITSVAPTTTACALTSITTGRPPADHGLLGYRLAAGDGELLNVLRWTVGTGSPVDARQTMPPRKIQSFQPFPGASAPVPVVSREGFGTTGFTAAHLGDAPLHGYAMASSIAVDVGLLLRRRVPFVYAYYDGLDKVAHAFGLGEHYDAELRSADALVGTVVESLPPGAVLVVTADHGQVEVGRSVEVLTPEVMSAVRFLSGEGRFRWLHVRPGATTDVVEASREHHGDQAWVATRQELEEGGWFGGPLRPEVADRLGDVALIPHAPVAFLDPADVGESRLASRHGSLTAEEMLVPLLALSERDNI